MNDGWVVTMNDHCITLDKGTQFIKFGIEIPTPTGYLCAMHYDWEAAMVAPTNTAEKSINNDEEPIPILDDTIHSNLGHFDEWLTWQTAKYLNNIESKKKTNICEACGVGDARQKNINKIANTIIFKEGEQHMHVVLIKHFIYCK